MFFLNIYTIIKSVTDRIIIHGTDLNAYRSKNTTAMGKYIRVFGHNTVSKLGFDIAASGRSVKYSGSIRIAFVWCDNIKFSWWIALGTDRM